ncbi:P-II family nitrogen regulator [Leptolyngbya sp. FACHB-17]|uniref:P-II family nitrogen regulator n=1 Tax=unclassified Leptolyngbya TaxID=2650499 RepID=UPI00168034A3|nr:P-II family nitrogen regulator [Leptolyngbya sp. FACHB-17]MBD2081635.1 P-II family nitrogen regulator [Leptolyngbya sp. FACHB-17]
MHAVKRIEIISDSIELPKILTSLKQSEIDRYTVFRNLESSGVSGSDEMIEMAYIIAFCAPEQLKDAIEKIRPILNRFGGSCYISDAMEVRSLNCTALI